MKNIITILITTIIVIFCISEATANNTGLRKAYSIISDTTIEINMALCVGQTVEVNGNIFDETNPSGIEIIIGANGCDSTIVIDLFFVDAIEYIFEEILCMDDLIIINGTVYDKNNTTGNEILENASVDGCDSIINVDLSFIDSGFTVNGSEMTANLSIADSYQWYLEGNPIDGATSNSWVALENGSYTLRIEVDGSICTSEAVFIEITNTQEIYQNSGINIFPNPVQDQIFIQLSDAFEGKIIRYELFNLEGQLIQNDTYKNTINVEELESGIFIFRLIDDNQKMYVQKLNVR